MCRKKSRPPAISWMLAAGSPRAAGPGSRCCATTAAASAASTLRIKEWDYYEIINPEYGIVLLIYDIGYQGRAVVKWMDFRAGTFEEHGPTLWLTRGSMGLPPARRPATSCSTVAAFGGCAAGVMTGCAPSSSPSRTSAAARACPERWS